MTNKLIQKQIFVKWFCVSW